MGPLVPPPAPYCLAGKTCLHFRGGILAALLAALAVCRSACANKVQAVARGFLVRSPLRREKRVTLLQALLLSCWKLVSGSPA